MSLFEGYERRIDKINGVLAEYGIKSVEECKEICLANGVDCDEIVRSTQPICFENAVWAYTVGAAIAIKKNAKNATMSATTMVGPVGVPNIIDANIPKNAHDTETIQEHTVTDLKVL